MLDKTNNSIGIDLGIKEFCITSDGKMIENPKHLKKSLDKLAKLQRELSRKTKGSSNRNKAELKWRDCMNISLIRERIFYKNYLLK